jgi:hypothetical protein
MWLFSWIRKKHYLCLREQLTSKQSPALPLDKQDYSILQEIKEKTVHNNCNNITRTMAYYYFYLEHPELEWALLAHMVSRNAGWSMTDLKGEWLPRLFTPKECNDYFLFIERANWLIFQDAYPQLLLYALSKDRGTNFFHLLPYLHVSRFMEIMWNDFWMKRNVARICTALIINEQNYIEKRVIEKKTYGAPIFADIKFFLQDLLDLNMLILPTYDGEKMVLYGSQVHAFPDLNHRINLGKKLYRLLFSKEVLPGLLAWCKLTGHSGSREDYMPQIFCSKKNTGWGKYEPRLKDLSLLPQAQRLYSPRLTDVWNDKCHERATTGDWFTQEEVVEQLILQESKAKIVNRAYGKLLSKIEKIVLAKQWLSH